MHEGLKPGWRAAYDAKIAAAGDVREAARRRRHRAWLSGLSDRDWARISALVAELEARRGVSPARLEGLDAPGLAIGACRPGEETRYSGEVIGRLRGFPILAWAL